MISAQLSETVHKMPPSSSSSADKKRVPSPFYGEDSSSEDEWEEDAEVEVKIKEEGEVDNSYSLGYSDLSDHDERRVEKTLWYKLMVKHNNIIPKYRPPQPTPTPPPPPRPRRLRALTRYAQHPTSGDDEEEFDKLFEFKRLYNISHPALTV